MDGRQWVLAGVAVLFLAFLLWRMRPGGWRERALGVTVRAARERARAATTPQARAEALCEAGTLAVKDGRRWTTAAGAFMRAMNADPTSAFVVEQLVLAFHRRRPRMLERILWRRLGNLPWDDAHRAVLLALSSALLHLYEKGRRHSARAAVFRRLSATFGDPKSESGLLVPPDPPPL